MTFTDRRHCEISHSRWYRCDNCETGIRISGGTREEMKLETTFAHLEFSSFPFEMRLAYFTSRYVTRKNLEIFPSEPGKSQLKAGTRNPAPELLLSRRKNCELNLPCVSSCRPRGTNWKRLVGSWTSDWRAARRSCAPRRTNCSCSWRGTCDWKRRSSGPSLKETAAWRRENVWIRNSRRPCVVCICSWIRTRSRGAISKGRAWTSCGRPISSARRRTLWRERWAPRGFRHADSNPRDSSTLLSFVLTEQIAPGEAQGGTERTRSRNTSSRGRRRRADQGDRHVEACSASSPRRHAPRDVLSESPSMLHLPLRQAHLRRSGRLSRRVSPARRLHDRNLDRAMRFWPFKNESYLSVS